MGKGMSGMRVFSMVWFGQLVSSIGSGLTGFALGVWIYQQTGSTTLFAVNILAYTLPNLLISPLAGALIDRWDRRLVLIMSDGGSALSTLMIALLYLSGRLEIWHIYVATAFNSAFGSFQWPAWSAATTMLVPKRHLGRASGMTQASEAIANLASPAMAGLLLVKTGIPGIVLVDFSTFLVAIFALLVVKFPQYERTAQSGAGKSSLFKEMTFGWKYISTRSGLLGLLIVFASTNFLNSLGSPLITPMLLEMTTPEILGYMASFIGVGMLIGTVVMSTWGGPKRRIHGVLGFLMVQGLFQILIGLRPSLPLMAASGFGMMLVFPIVNGSSQALWQSKVPPGLQGRVFAVRRMIAWSIMPIATMLAGPMHDYVFSPLMAENGILAGSVGLVLGTGPGRGAGLIFVMTGLLTILVVAAAGYGNPRVRHLEDELPDTISETPDEANSPGTTTTPAPASPKLAKSPKPAPGD
jgi:MFS transporter, DHA3 family, macrolide efflux protein